ncbi:hypothetical protein ABW20_dc0104311 [Dactylellina cionopaga]|nr:hypothetical protein ABW20_dc0104311 [Dactylellina cionopaga]
MHSRHILVAALSLTATAIPIVRPSANGIAVVKPRGLLDGLLGSGGLLGGLLGGVTGGGAGDAAGGITDGIGAGGGLPVGGDLLSGLQLDGLLGSILSLDDGLLGGLLGGLGIDSETGILGGLLGGLLGGGKPETPGLDPSKQKVKSGTAQSAKPQDGFVFQNVMVYSPKVGLLDVVLQLLLGGKKSMWITKTPNGSSVKSSSGATFKIDPNSVEAVCFSNDITATKKPRPIACTVNVLGFVQNKLIGALKPKVVQMAKRSVSGSKKTTVAPEEEEEEEEEETENLPESLEVDEIRMAFTPVSKKAGAKNPIKSVMLKFNFRLGN